MKQLLVSVTMLFLPGIPCGCKSGFTNIFKTEDSMPMPSIPMKKVSIGRADLMVPQSATVTMTGTVNEVDLSTTEIKPGEDFSKLWSEHLREIASGHADDSGGSAVRRLYPATSDSGQVYFEQGKDPRMLVVMERWRLIGSTIVKGQESFEPRYLSEVEGDMEKVFTHMSVGGQAGSGTSRSIPWWYTSGPKAGRNQRMLPSSLMCRRPMRRVPAWI